MGHESTLKNFSRTSAMNVAALSGFCFKYARIIRQLAFKVSAELLVVLAEIVGIGTWASNPSTTVNRAL
jgi:hypothetical protein